MTISNRLSLSTVFCASLLGVAASSYAGLIGSTMTANYYYAGGIQQDGYATGVVSGSVLGTYSSDRDGLNGAIYRVSVTDTQVILDFSVNQNGPFTWTTSILSLDAGGLVVNNGTALFFTGAPEITSVSLDALSNMGGLDASRITFNGSAVAINWYGLSFDNNTRVVLNVNSVPAPGALALLGAVGFVGSRRRRD